MPLKQAVKQVLTEGYRTGDIMVRRLHTRLGTAEMGDLIAAAEYKK